MLRLRPVRDGAPATPSPAGRDGHGLFLAALTLGAALRALAMLGYRPALWFSDSYDYAAAALRLFPQRVRPDGYALFLAALRPFHSFSLVVGAQHLLGLAVGGLVYVLARRHGVAGWAATLAALPVLADAHQVQLEHLVLSDTLFMALATATVAVVVWRPVPGWRAAAVAGGLLGVATLTRSVGLPLAALLIVALTAWRVGWRAVVAAALAAAVPVVAYATWFHAWWGRFALTESDGVFLYARTMTFADCARIEPPASTRRLCPTEPAGRRPPPQHYIWDRDAPLNRLPGGRFTAATNARALTFALAAIRAQPLDYARTIGVDLGRALRPDRPVYPDPVSFGLYEFPASDSRLNAELIARRGDATRSADRYERGPARTAVVAPYAAALRGYQRLAYLPGLGVGVILLVGAAGLARRRPSRRPAALAWGAAVVLFVVPVAVAQFDYRYVLPAVPLACLAAALATRPLR